MMFSVAQVLLFAQICLSTVQAEDGCTFGSTDERCAIARDSAQDDDADAIKLLQLSSKARRQDKMYDTLKFEALEAMQSRNMHDFNAIDAQQLTTLGNHDSVDSHGNDAKVHNFGFLWCYYVPGGLGPMIGYKAFSREFNLSVHAAHNLFPKVPKAVYSNRHERASGRPEDKVIPTHYNVTLIRVLPEHKDIVEPWHQKLIALKRTPFEYTIFLDSDVYLLRRGFVTAMQTILEVADIAMPLDPKRTEPYDVLPMGCSAITAYNHNAFKLIDKAIELMVNKKYDLENIRQGDQEMLYFAWRDYEHSIRFTLLPAEFYCPWNGLKTTWQDSHETYSCWALHDHDYRKNVLTLQEKGDHERNRSSGLQ
mmetsp:Transcript_137233/g.256236  ORF Transcript_137233/g.256236 Transcript_137233/m.256236 type:complete len:366 (-) Transcript_137233:118-1215(-)